MIHGMRAQTIRQATQRARRRARGYAGAVSFLPTQSHTNGALDATIIAENERHQCNGEDDPNSIANTYNFGSQVSEPRTGG